MLRNTIRSAAAACVSAGAVMVVAPEVRGETIVVNMFSFEYSTGPAGTQIDPTINVGDTIRWVCLDGFHTTTSVAGIAEQWDSGILRTGQEFSRTFTIAGRYEYFCLPHGSDNGDGTASGMAGVITVVPAPGSLAVVAMAGAGVLRRRRGR